MQCIAHRPITDHFTTLDFQSALSARERPLWCVVLILFVRWLCVCRGSPPGLSEGLCWVRFTAISA